MSTASPSRTWSPTSRCASTGGSRRSTSPSSTPGMGKIVENLRRVVICQKEPKLGTKGAYKMRDHEQAEKDLDPLYAVMTEAKDCQYGLWTNGLEFFFFEKQVTRFDVKFQPLATGRWAMTRSARGRRIQRLSAARRPRDAADRLPALPQLHSRQRGHAEGRGLLAVPLPHLRENARRAPRTGRAAALLGRHVREGGQRTAAARRRAVRPRRPEGHPHAHRAAFR